MAIAHRNNTSYQLRADLLAQAEGIIRENNELQLRHFESLPNRKEPLPLLTIDPHEVIKIAERLNDFVSQRN